jgi:hypothetical protein
MNEVQKGIKDWSEKFGQVINSAPTVPSLEVRKLRAKLILEEALETVEALGFIIHGREVDKLLNEHLEVEPNLIELADGLADLTLFLTAQHWRAGLIWNLWRRKF